MQSYTVHEPPEAPADRIDRAEQLAFVKDGFHWSAAIFGPLWLIAKRLWLALLVYLLVLLAMTLGLAALGASDQAAGLASLGLHVLMGFEADAIERMSLDRRGWQMLGTVNGRNTEECERRFFEAWLPGQPQVRPSFAEPASRAGTLASAAGGLAMAGAGAVDPRQPRAGWRRLLARS